MEINLKEFTNPYEGDQPSKKILEIIKQKQVLHKKFNDIDL